MTQTLDEIYRKACADAKSFCLKCKPCKTDAACMDKKRSIVIKAIEKWNRLNA